VNPAGVFYYPFPPLEWEKHPNNVTNFVSSLDLYEPTPSTTKEQEFPATPLFGTYTDIVEGFEAHSGVKFEDKSTIVAFMVAYLFATGLNNSHSLDPVMTTIQKRKNLYFLRFLIYLFFRWRLQKQSKERDMTCPWVR